MKKVFMLPTHTAYMKKKHIILRFNSLEDLEQFNEKDLVSMLKNKDLNYSLASDKFHLRVTQLKNVYITANQEIFSLNMKEVSIHRQELLIYLDAIDFVLSTDSDLLNYISYAHYNSVDILDVFSDNLTLNLDFGSKIKNLSEIHQKFIPYVQNTHSVSDYLNKIDNLK